MSKKIFIGTSGWSYEHWKGVFYPEDLPANRWFEYYCDYFNTVEINNSFYQLPSIKTFKDWHRQAPKNFIFSVKGSRFITHMKKLKDPQKSIKKFLTHTSYLKDKLGPILFQLPPHWRLNLERLSCFIKSLPRDLKFVFEFRENSWFDRKVFGLLNKEKIGFCVHDMRGVNCPCLMTGNLAYIRFHGTTSLYGGKYTKAQLEDWALFVKKCEKKGKVYIYFNNDAEGYAVENALEFKKILRA
jgi:uncharacterized protein YecE (DUF72 family)